MRGLRLHLRVRHGGELGSGRRIGSHDGVADGAPEVGAVSAGHLPARSIHGQVGGIGSGAGGAFVLHVGEVSQLNVSSLIIPHSMLTLLHGPAPLPPTPPKAPQGRAGVVSLYLLLPSSLI